MNEALPAVFAGPVEFTGAVAPVLSEELCQLAEAELRQVFNDKRVQSVIVSRCYSSYSGVSRDLMVLGVEVRLGEVTGKGGEIVRSREFRTDIVKLGTPERVGGDMQGWEDCTQGRDVASRILVPPRSCPLRDGRVAVIYRDAYTLFGPDRDQSRPESLERVVEWAVKDDKPDPVSVERAISHTFTDLGRWFYPGAKPAPEPALAFYRKRLRRALPCWVCLDGGGGRKLIVERHTELLKKALGVDPGTNPCERGRDRWRQELRRDTVWLLCGRDAPDGTTDAVYLDPCEYVAWALAHEAVPPTLVGRSHGDLHGRNVLLGVLRGEADYPAVFDYGEMRPDNVLAWDFVKLEMSLKLRLLPDLYRDDAAREAVLAGRSWRVRGQELPPDAASDTAGRADRLDFAYHFEALLADLTAKVQGRSDAEQLRPPGGRRDVVRNPKIDRLLGILLRIRQEAALWLGYERGRLYDWREEYYFALAVYGVSTAKWDYEPLWTECALVSAGVAAGRLQKARDTIRSQVQDGRPLDDGYPSHRVPLALAHARWKAGQFKEALDVIEKVRPLYEHAVPLQQEYGLLLAEQEKLNEARQLLEPLRDLCRVFGDYETLCRIGRVYKSIGDRHWTTPGARGKQLPAVVRSMYGLALQAYEEAFALNRHYYPGGNAATLALLLRDRERAAAHAADVLKSCRERQPKADEKERFWVLVSAGEALLVGGEGREAAGYYESALEDLQVAEVWMAQSAYNQLCRLWYALDDDVLGPVLKVFDRKPLAGALKAGPVGDCGDRRKTAAGTV